MGTFNDVLRELHGLEGDCKVMRDLCRQALHWMETPGDFSAEDTSALMLDLAEYGYPNKDEDDEDSE